MTDEELHSKVQYQMNGGVVQKKLMKFQSHLAGCYNKAVVLLNEIAWTILNSK